MISPKDGNESLLKTTTLPLLYLVPLTSTQFSLGSAGRGWGGGGGGGGSVILNNAHHKTVYYMYLDNFVVSSYEGKRSKITSLNGSAPASEVEAVVKYKFGVAIKCIQCLTWSDHYFFHKRTII